MVPTTASRRRAQETQTSVLKAVFDVAARNALWQWRVSSGAGRRKNTSCSSTIALHLWCFSAHQLLAASLERLFHSNPARVHALCFSSEQEWTLANCSVGRWFTALRTIALVCMDWVQSQCHTWSVQQEFQTLWVLWSPPLPIVVMFYKKLTKLQRTSCKVLTYTVKTIARDTKRHGHAPGDSLNISSTLVKFTLGLLSQRLKKPFNHSRSAACCGSNLAQFSKWLIW
jgi:hypothetical protein